MTISLSTALTALCLVLAQAAHAETPRDAVKKAHEAYLGAINANDLDLFLEAVTDDVVLIAPNAPVMSGKDEVAPWVAGYFEAVTTRWQKTSVEFVVAGDWAYEHYTYRVIDSPRDGGTVAVDTGNGLNIYRREADGVWRVARDAWATNQPLPPSYDGLGPF